MYLFAFNTSDTSPNQGGVDPLFGPKDPADPDIYSTPYFYYRQNTDGADQYADSYGAPVPLGSTTDQGPPLPKFVRTDGGLYVFLPSITALELMSQGKIA
jgi:hypothetical protein